MANIKLGRLRDRSPVKMTVSIASELNELLRLYADFYREAYGDPRSVQELIPAMLAGYMEGDRAFAGRRRAGLGS